MDIMKFKLKKLYIRVLFKDKVFLMLRRCQMNDIWERRSVLWKGMQVTKNEHTIIGTPVITFSKPCSLYTQQYHQRERTSYTPFTHIVLLTKTVFCRTKVLWNEKSSFIFVGMGNKMHFWILIFESSWNVNLSAYILPTYILWL